MEEVMDLVPQMYRQGKSVFALHQSLLISFYFVTEDPTAVGVTVEVMVQLLVMDPLDMDILLVLL